MIVFAGYCWLIYQVGRSFRDRDGDWWIESGLALWILAALRGLTS